MRKVLKIILITTILLSLLISGISCSKSSPSELAPPSPQTPVSATQDETKSDTEQILENVKAYINVTFLLYGYTYKDRDEEKIKYCNGWITDYKNERQPDDSDMKLGQARYDARNTLYTLPQIQENLAIVRVTIQRWDASDRVFDILLRHETFHNEGGLSWYDWAVTSVTIIR